MQFVGIGFIIGVIQDSCETALNSSSDVLFTACTEYRRMRKEGIDFKPGKDDPKAIAAEEAESIIPNLTVSHEEAAVSPVEQAVKGDGEEH